MKLRLVRNALTAIVIAAASGVAIAAGEGWKYATQQDPMTGRNRTTATLISDNTLTLEFPYASESNFGAIAVRHSQRGEVQVILIIEKGQIMCRPNDCSIQVRFDDSPPVQWKGSPTAELSPTALFINSEAKFIAALRKAKRLRVQLSFFQQGTRILEFTTLPPLQWPPAANP